MRFRHLLKYQFINLSKGGARNAPSLSGCNFSHFHSFREKNWQSNRSGSHLLELASPTPSGKSWIQYCNVQIFNNDYLGMVVFFSGYTNCDVLSRQNKIFQATCFVIFFRCSRHNHTKSIAHIIESSWQSSEWIYKQFFRCTVKYQNFYKIHWQKMNDNYWGQIVGEIPFVEHAHTIWHLVSKETTPPKWRSTITLLTTR